MASSVVTATSPERTGLTSQPISEPKADSPQFGNLLDSQLAAASVPFAPYPLETAPPAKNANSINETSQRIEGSDPRQGKRRQRK